MKRKGLSLAIILAGLCTVDMVNAETTSLGLGVGMSDYGYRDTDNLVFPLPVINYEKGNFFIHSLSTGYYLWKNENNKIAVDAWYNPLSFNPDDSDSAQMNQLDKRHSTVMAGFTWDHFQRWGVIHTSISGDILGNSDGWIAEAAWLYPIHSGDWEVVPSFGVTWNSSDQNNYYYGVSHNESVKSGMAEYSADDSWNPYMELAVKYQFAPSWHTTGLVRATHYGDGAADSPMLENNMSFQAMLGVAYDF